jgi:leader peptidase (prepilin peptidase)/N-methyltransferase
MLRGRCRACATRISPRYPLLEAGTGAVFALIVAVRGLDVDLAWQLPLAAVLIAVAVIDLDHKLIPNRILLPAAVWGLVTAVAIRPSDLPTLLMWGAGAFAFFLGAALLYPAGMGMGDVKLAGVMGLYLGNSVVPALFVALLAGSLVGIAIIARHGAKGRKMGVPFGPFLALGGIVGLLAGPDLVRIYTDNLL